MLVSLRKIEKLQLLAFNNALRLHWDSIFLFRNGSYASGLFLSLLAREECGKAFILDDFIFHSSIDGRMDTYWEQKWIDGIYSHLSKHNVFAGRAEEILGKKFYKDVFSGTTEFLKQQSIYVGLKRVKGKANLKSRIYSPFVVTKKQANTYITLLNDFFIYIIAGKLIGFLLPFDSESVDKLLTKRLLQKLLRWENKGAIAKRLLRRMTKER